MGDTESPIAITLDLIVDVTALLEGPFDGSEMQASLNEEGIIPLNQPFNVAPWNYAGGESMAVIPKTNVVDWVLVELRDATDAVSATSATTVARQAAFLKNNGVIVGMDGFQCCLYLIPRFLNYSLLSGTGTTSPLCPPIPWLNQAECTALISLPSLTRPIMPDKKIWEADISECSQVMPMQMVM